MQLLFEESIKEVQELDPGYDDHASDVWLVKTDEQEVVVRSSRMSDEPSNEFWWGCKSLFGIDPRNVFGLEQVNNILHDISPIPIPKVLKKRTISSREFVVVEKLTGAVVQSFKNQPPSILQNLGEGLAKIHQYQVNYVGSPSGNFKVPLERYKQHVNEIIRDLVLKFHKDHAAIREKLPEMSVMIENLPNPQFTTFVLVDIDPTQFLSNNQELTGLVDTEAYVIAPRELDFIGLEYILDKDNVKDFITGYERVKSIPDLSNCRLPYRYLYRLLSVQGDVDIDKWLNHDNLF
ncbi:aminoglycoside phosphotransferase family protein [Bacillus sp. SM2101]|uniref:aminoglycoside phosphotransferase family protein n=1 Tax=Bacillus sp. SM2101 TaxID=2805366 RepID=UPI00331D7983